MLSLTAGAQVFKAIVKPGPFVVGESFRVQYILEDNGTGNEFIPPDFINFRLVNSPSEGLAYDANSNKKLKNIIYTLEATRPGRFIINGARAKIGDHFIKSNDVRLEVISRAEAAGRGLLPGSPETSNAYFLPPGEDPYRKIQENLFLKVRVDKKACFVGEAVTATFTLYSRLMSRSDIVKNPGFYGFTVQDMVGLNDNETSAETINGKSFDVHTIRKVQLYPLQAGVFTIDPMEVVNKVEFSLSVVSRKPEPKITEEAYGEPERAKEANIEEYTTNITTPAIHISVKPVPSRNKPAGFAGAAGRFSISAAMEKNRLAGNEEGALIITIAGQGNFTQLAAPAVQWPTGLEGFEPRVTDALDHSRSPMKGSRRFRFPFVPAKPGQYSIPAISFSFFDPDSNSYKTTVTAPVTVTVSNREKATGTVLAKPGKTAGSNRIVWIGIIVLAVLMLVVAGLFRYRRSKKPVSNDEEQVKPQPTVAGILRPAVDVLDADDKVFYTTLRNCIWEFMAIHFGLAGSRMNSLNLQIVLNRQMVEEQYQAVVIALLQQCDTGIFADAYIDTDKKELLNRAGEVLEKISRSVH